MRRRTIAFLILALVLGAGITGAGAWSARQPRAYAPHGPGATYLALGDSLAWGASLADSASESYPALIHAALAEAGTIELVNLSVPGETSGSFVAWQLPRAVALLEAARRDGRRISPITLDIGGNDLRNVERAGPVAREAAIVAARRNIARSLDALRAAAGPTADIAIMTYYNPYGGDPAVHGSDAFWVERLNAAIREEAGRRGVAVADVYLAFEGGRAYTHTFALLGDIHANAQGHALIAETFVTALGYRRAVLP